MQHNGRLAQPSFFLGLGMYALCRDVQCGGIRWSVCRRYSEFAISATDLTAQSSRAFCHLGAQQRARPQVMIERVAALAVWSNIYVSAIN